MDISSCLLICILTYFLILIVAHFIKNRRFYQLGFRIPGVTAMHVLKNRHLFSKDLRIYFKEMQRLIDKHGQFFRIIIGPLMVLVVTDPVVVEKYINIDKIGSRGPYNLKLLGPMFQNGLISLGIDLWRPHRKLINTAFHIVNLEKFVKSFAKHSDFLTRKIKYLSDVSTSFELYPFLSLCTIDVICETGFSYDLNAQLNHNEIPLIYTQTVGEASTIRMAQPWLFSDLIFKLSSYGKEYFKAVDYFHKMIKIGTSQKAMELQKAVDEGSEKIPSLANVLLENGELTQEEILGEMSSIAGAGSETTASTCNYVLALLSEHQDIQKKVMEEQEMIFGNDMLRPVTKDDLPMMKYLEQVINESLRLFPPVPMGYRFTQAETDVGNGYIIPAGVTIVVSMYHIHRNPEYFPDPDKFDPDRFSPENSAGRNPYTFMPFGFGRRKCVGWVFAIMEAKTMVSTLLRNYHFTKIDNDIRYLENDLKVGLVLKTESPIKFQLQTRSYSSDKVSARG